MKEHLGHVTVQGNLWIVFIDIERNWSPLGGQWRLLTVTGTYYVGRVAAYLNGEFCKKYMKFSSDEILL